jgi:hypothetical protein
MPSSSVRSGLRSALPLLLLSLAFAVPSAHADNVITGTLEKVDTGAKTITVKTADGTEEVVKYTGKTTADGAKSVAHAADLVGKEGGHVIIHCTTVGTDKVAHSIHYVGDKTVHATEGTVEDIGKDGKTITIKTADGTEKVFDVSGHATMDAGKDVGVYTADGVKKGAHVTVYSTEEAGKSIAHVFSHL